MGWNPNRWARILGERGRYIGPPDPLPVLDAGLGRLSNHEGGGLATSGARRNYAGVCIIDPPVGGLAGGFRLPLAWPAQNTTTTIIATGDPAWPPAAWFEPGYYRVALQFRSSVWAADEGLIFQVYNAEGDVVGRSTPGSVTNDLVTFVGGTGAGSAYDFDLRVLFASRWVIGVLTQTGALDDADIGIVTVQVEDLVPFDDPLNQ